MSDLHVNKVSRVPRAFTLVELLVVIGVIGLLIAVLLPVLQSANRAAKAVKCLSNVRNMQVAHWMYINNNRGQLINAGLSHGGSHGNEDVAWINTLQPYYSLPLVARCPADDSVHWQGPSGVPVMVTMGPTGLVYQYRRSSYGINNYLDAELTPGVKRYFKVNQVRQVSKVIHFLEMTETGSFAGADHPHVELWIGNIPVKASQNLEINQHGGPSKSWQGKATYGFLDGHAETLRFSSVYRSHTDNLFDPEVAK